MERFEQFIADAEDDMATYQKKVSGNGQFEYSQQVRDLIEFSNKASLRTLVYMFGEHLGNHLWMKWKSDCKGDLLYFLSKLTAEYSFFILYEIKTNKMLYCN